MKRVIWTGSFRREPMTSIPHRAAAMMVRRRIAEHQAKHAEHVARVLEFNRQAQALATAPAQGHA